MASTKRGKRHGGTVQHGTKGHVGVRGKHASSQQAAHAHSAPARKKRLRVRGLRTQYRLGR